MGGWMDRIVRTYVRTYIHAYIHCKEIHYEMDDNKSHTMLLSESTDITGSSCLVLQIAGTSAEAEKTLSEAAQPHTMF